jgi:hypothetical protein
VPDVKESDIVTIGKKKALKVSLLQEDGTTVDRFIPAYELPAWAHLPHHLFDHHDRRFEQLATLSACLSNGEKSLDEIEGDIVALINSHDIPETSSYVL